MGDLDKRLTIRLDDELIAALEHVTKSRKTQAASIVRQALHEFLLKNDDEYREAHEREMRRKED